MSNPSIRGSQQATGDPAAPATSARTHYEQLAAEFMTAIDKVVEIVPKIEMAHQSTAKFVRTHQGVPAEFLRTAIAVVEQTPDLQLLNKLDVTVARDTLQFFEAFRPVVDKLRVLAQSLKFTVDARYANVAADALQVYSIAKGLARDPGSAAVAAHLENLSRDLGRRRPRPRVVPAAAKQKAG